MQSGTMILLDNGTDASIDLQGLLRANGITVLRLEDYVQAVELLREGQCAGVVLNLRSCPEWKELLRQTALLESGVSSIAVADKGTVAEAVEVVREGAGQYLERPLTPELFLREVQRVGELWAEKRRLRVSTSSGTDRSCGFADIIGRSEKIQEVFRLVEKVGDSDATVLVQGESGTGKELVARALHFEGARRLGPFVPVNCGAIPGELLESELFGHEKGAFTHAIRTRIGRFEMADGGTVFLDEIAEMSPMLQVKILRVLQERRFERIGGTKTIKSDFRVITATNRDLDAEVAVGRFREDLYYRLNVIPIMVPPLRERPSDIPLLVDHFIEQCNRCKKKAITGIDSEVVAHFIRYPWPGNVRELENVVERMVILAGDSRLTLQDLPEKLLLAKHERQAEIHEIPDDGFFLSEEVASFEKRLIIQALNQTGWVKNRAAKLLNINRTTLLEKLKKYGLAQK